MFTNRFQQVSIERVLSNSTPVICGVPQGSVLGLILFVMLVNDLDKLFNGKSALKLVADDPELYRSFQY